MEPFRLRAGARQHARQRRAAQQRHALLQTEQNALAEMTDDVLRQQAGVLMSPVSYTHLDVYKRQH